MLHSKRMFSSVEPQRLLKVGIIGGSLAGLFTGVALQRLGFDVEIFEKGNNARIGAGFSATWPLMDYLQKFDIINSSNFDSNFLPSYQTDIISKDDRIEVKDHSNEPRFQSTWDCLYWSTFNKLINNENMIHFNKKMVTIDCNNNNDHLMRIDFADNSQYECDLVIGCDGLGSNVRSYIAMNRNTNMEYAGYAIWRGVVESSKISPQSKLYQLRHGNKLIMYHGSCSQFLCYMVPNYYNKSDHLYNWAWYVCYDEEELRNNLLIDRNNKQQKYSMQRGYVRDDVHLELNEYAEKMLPPTLNELVLLTKDPFFQIVYDYKCKSMVEYNWNHNETKQGGIILVGDSAFVPRPHTARGVSKASGDVLCLYDNLNKFINNELSLNDAFNAYNNERIQIGNEAVDSGIELGKRVISNDQTRNSWSGAYIRTPFASQ